MKQKTKQVTEVKKNQGLMEIKDHERKQKKKEREILKTSLQKLFCNNKA